MTQVRTQSHDRSVHMPHHAADTQQRKGLRVRALVSVQLADYDTLVDRHEVLDVDESVLAAVHLERLEGFHDELPEVFPPLLAVIDAVSEVVFARREKLFTERGEGTGVWKTSTEHVDLHLDCSMGLEGLGEEADCFRERGDKTQNVF